ncbi:MAG: hypothetical protein JWR12_1719 [Mucilaginibacter sp.]|nr:hypothetical protein [Mucilaginibacter sp.]
MKSISGNYFVMDNSFFAYLQNLELMAFFSGYPLIYTIALFIAGNFVFQNSFNTRLTSLVPLGYALLGTLFLGFQLKKLYADYSIENIKLSFQHPYLIIWGLLSMLFWIPAFRKKKLLSLMHSLVFFFFLVRDLLLQVTASAPDYNIISNDMKVYLNSILLNLGILTLMILLSFLFTRYSKHKHLINPEV